jgi:tyrosyl-tRNA synthetase
LEGLPDAGPAELRREVVQGGGADERANFAAAVAFVRGLYRLPFDVTLPLIVGGKKPPVRR